MDQTTYGKDSGSSNGFNYLNERVIILKFLKFSQTFSTWTICLQNGKRENDRFTNLKYLYMGIFCQSV